ncbi:TPA: hypothetical protein ACGW7B_001222 [Bacillus nitratireducens]|uniref:hypothetical protein n=1 Tax=Bacillus cereus group TaxID=86661 RepID=UPI0007784800|nr:MULTISPECIES: hypothetical protein [Bacillus cereus group]KXY03891.1 hypothetical protein AT271_07735 [Bacillus cereus]ARZ62172.1 hypothetical protein B7P25_10275 [Bacillus thuringiensis]MCC2436632.1 hypothetical protein [Bacillus paranthracis]MCU5079368.1 hypothetical protein [Bacillus cereus]MDG1605591.1 hypothetical protein [Bacillus paranthracis]
MESFKSKETIENVEGVKVKNKRAVGIRIKWYENGEYKQTFPSIQATARFMKEYVQRATLPFASIHKSIREGIDWRVRGSVHSFRYEDKYDKKIQYKKMRHIK